jgi:hypothetical protein
MEESDLPGAGETSETGGAGLSPEQLREYLRHLDPEDFGRFNP